VQGAGVVGFDKDKRPSRNVSEIPLRIIRAIRIEPFRRGLRVIGAGHLVELLDRANDGAVPTVVVYRANEPGFIDASELAKRTIETERSIKE
jgi:hypothetical protein